MATLLRVGAAVAACGSTAKKRTQSKGKGKGKGKRKGKAKQKVIPPELRAILGEAEEAYMDQEYAALVPCSTLNPRAPLPTYHRYQPITATATATAAVGASVPGALRTRHPSEVRLCTRLTWMLM